MKKYLFILILISGLSCQKERSALQDHLSLQLSTWQDKGRTKASVMPVLKADSDLMPYRLRFDYLLLNIPEIHGFDKIKARDSINSLYPDTVEVRRRYFDLYCQDEKLVEYFDRTYAGVKDPGLQKESYTTDELMEVASKFFYCDQVNPDTSVQSHVCIGLNGIKEARWEKDYTLLAAFCYEAIFNDFEKEPSRISDAWGSEKDLSRDKFRKNITALDRYLEDVKLELFDRMKNNAALKEELRAYYELNKDNLAFRIIK